MTEKPQAEKQPKVKTDLKRPWIGRGYPSVRYHASLGPTVVNDASEDRALDDGWTDSYAAHDLEAKVVDGRMVFAPKESATA